MSFGNSFWLDLIKVVLEWTPYFAVFAIGAVAALAVAIRKPLVALLMLAAIALLTARAVGSILVAGISFWLYSGGSMEAFSIVPALYTVRAIFAGIAGCLAWALLVAAALVGRDGAGGPQE